jgi:hypothetical protein
MRQTLKKYWGSKMPPFLAEECKGLIKPGMDGNPYVSRPSAQGVYRWVPAKGTERKTRRGRRVYNTYDYSGKHYTVVLTPGKHVEVFPQVYDEVLGDYVQGERAYRAAYKNIWIGRDMFHSGSKWKDSIVGKSILIQTGANRYTYIGDSIFEFSLKPGNSVVGYRFHEGGKDAPSSGIFGKKFAYLLQNESASYLPMELLEGDV